MSKYIWFEFVRTARLVRSGLLELAGLVPDGEPGDETLAAELRRQPVILALYPTDWSPVCSDQMALYHEELPEFQSSTQRSWESPWTVSGVTLRSRSPGSKTGSGRSLTGTGTTTYGPTRLVNENHVRTRTVPNPARSDRAPTDCCLGSICRIADRPQGPAPRSQGIAASAGACGVGFETNGVVDAIGGELSGSVVGRSHS